MTDGGNGDRSADADGAPPVLPYLASDRVQLAKQARPETPPLAKAIVVGVPLAMYATMISGDAMLPRLTQGVFLALITVWWIAFRTRTCSAFPRTTLHVWLATFAFTGALILFCGRVGAATEGPHGLRYWTADNPGYRYGRHHALRVAPFVIGAAAWFVCAAGAFAVQLWRRARR